ncbi:MFS transporter [Picrophilus oshimae]|uniref:MFS transporter, SP family, inositol transporter n=1 Tax=Picrophilus torridus (strain ATCC 700027 / DSM 9790 / JCM 10055 / NBRC 100828 / KAW 2/3) TaxID=1122961 RepID=A0A8G2L6V3_PICTO|nr:MFS transporter [Picrophilus oshimae]SMD30310.1 MFS transporter, SP family, inositol transporter [Picrophilus oshimae DSM 9789]
MILIFYTIGNVIDDIDNARTSSLHLKWTVITTLGDFLDGAMFGITGITLIPLIPYLHLNSFEQGIPAFLTLLGTAAGAISVSRLGDKFGRKHIYSFDAIIYGIAAIMLSITFNLYWAMVFFFMVGFGVGGDVPNSWSLLIEFAPKDKRGSLFSFTYILWFLGGIIGTLLAVLLVPYGMLLFRIEWAFFGIIAFFVWFLRKQLPESPRYNALNNNEKELISTANMVGSNEKNIKSYKRHAYRELFNNYGRYMLLAFLLYMMCGIPESTNGEFYPYIFRLLGLSLAQSYELEAMIFIITLLSVFVFRYIVDLIGRVKTYIISGSIYAAGMYMLGSRFVYHSIYLLIFTAILLAVGLGLGFDIINRLYSTVHLPVSIRASGQGLIWFSLRIEVAFFGLYTPYLISVYGLPVLYTIFGFMILLDVITIIVLNFKSPGMVNTEKRSIDELAGE